MRFPAGSCDRQISGAYRAPKWRVLQQAGELLLFEPFDDLADVLRALARAEQEGVVCFQQNKVLPSYRGEKFPGCPEIISAGVQGERRAGGNVRAALRR